MVVALISVSCPWRGTPHANALQTTTLDSTDRLVYRTAQGANFNAKMVDVFHVFGDVIQKMTVMIIVMKVQIAQRENVGQVRILKRYLEIAYLFLNSDFEKCSSDFHLGTMFANAVIFQFLQ